MNSKFRLRRYLFEAGYKYITWLRITNRLYTSKYKRILFPFFVISWIKLKHLGYKYSFDISYKAQIGDNFQIAHYGYIIIPSKTIIGDNCRVRPGVVIGVRDIYTKENSGTIIGSNVEFGVGAKIMGPITIGDNVMIGANAVVTKDIPPNSVVVGVPARVIRQNNPIVNYNK